MTTLRDDTTPDHFWIHPDWRGMYRWKLVGKNGLEVARGKYGHAAYAGAFSSAGHERNARGLPADFEIRGTFR